MRYTCDSYSLILIIVFVFCSVLFVDGLPELSVGKLIVTFVDFSLYFVDLSDFFSVLPRLLLRASS
ncbi:unnamed protein product [Schistosoma margrebowiei]|uniref:Uncharacterized protein n=1 Tax=Schistosoma margrebowiei TaxID=48269 RepID=A0A183MST5_9TREM|nr:unnamed protein product [Schistosoma margrebowiei]